MDQRVIPAEKPKVDERSPAQRLADLEAWASRIGWHVSALYVLLGLAVAKLIWDLMAWGDFIVTGR